MALWKDIVGYEGLYQISDDGKVYSLPRVVFNGRGKYVRPGRELKQGLRGNKGLQYAFVILSDGNTTKHKSVHRLVAEAFVENPFQLDVVNHIDHNPLNNRADNLEWCTQQYNNEYGHNKAIEQYDEIGNLLGEFKNITTASEETNVSRRAINNCLTGWSKKAGGYVWKYKTKEMEG